MNLGLAAQSFFKQNEHLQDRDHLAKQRAYQQQVMDSEAAGLDDQSAATRGKNKLSAAQSQAGLEVLPAETQNRQTQQEIDNSNLSYQKEQLPNVQANATKATQVQSAGLDGQVAQIPENEKKRVSANATAASERHQSALIQLSHLITANDKAGAIAHLNATTEAEAVQAGTKGKKFVDIRAVGENTAGGDNRAFELVADDGQSVKIPYAAVTQAAAMTKTEKYKAIQDTDTGRVITLNENTGALEEKIAADPARLRVKESGKTPEMQQQFEFLTIGPTGPKLSKEEAKEMIMKGARKTPEDRFHMYQTELIKANASAVGSARQTPEQIRKNAIGMSGYDPSSAAGLSNNQPTPATSNTQKPLTINPKYGELFKP